MRRHCPHRRPRRRLRRPGTSCGALIGVVAHDRRHRHDELDRRLDAGVSEHEVGEGVGPGLVDRHRVAGITTCPVVLLRQTVDGRPHAAGGLGRQPQPPERHAWEVAVRSARHRPLATRSRCDLLDRGAVGRHGRAACTAGQVGRRQVGDVVGEEPRLELLQRGVLERLARAHDRLHPVGLEVTAACGLPRGAQLVVHAPGPVDPGVHGAG